MACEEGEGLTYSTPKDSTNQYGTPPQLIRELESCLGDTFDLDPCSGAEDDRIADDIYTKEDDGLAQDWFGNVFVNPPFSECGEWVKKAFDEQRNKEAERVVLLLPVRLAAGYFHQYVSKANAICFVEGRIDYVGEDGIVNGVPFASYLSVCGDAKPFLEYFERKCTVYTPNDNFKSTKQTSL
jgi:phage N-6-adenine-methyltransferase